MPTVRIYRSKKLADNWGLVADKLDAAGLQTHRETGDADVSISLGGMYINPLVLTGKRVLCHNVAEWLPAMQKPFGWSLYKTVLDEYYDEFMDLTGMSDSHKVLAIRQYVEEKTNDT